jgi:hypothetical protein
MRTTLNITILLAFVLSNAQADDIRFRNGQTLKNCLVLDTLGTRVKIKTSEGERLFPFSTIDEIVKSAFDSSRTSYILDADGSPISTKRAEQPSNIEIQTPTDHTYISEKAYTYPNTFLLPLSAIALGLAWDYFAQVSDIQDAIDASNKSASQSNVQIDNSNLESEKTRKTILGVTFLAAGIINTVFAFKRVEVTATSNSIGLSYKF